MAQTRFQREIFHPTYLSVFVNPMFFNRYGLLQGIRHFAAQIHGRVLDFGCGTKPYKELFTNASEYIGIDMKNKGFDYEENDVVDIYYDGKTIPFENGHFDCVFSSEVFEHVFEIDATLEEINRVMKKDGLLLFTIPFFWEEHAEPYDYCRYSSFGIKYLLEKHGFEVIENYKSGNHVTTVFQMMNTYFLNLMGKGNRLVRKVLMLLSAFHNLSGLALSAVFPESKKVYLNNIVLARKVK